MPHAASAFLIGVVLWPIAAGAAAAEPGVSAEAVRAAFGGSIREGWRSGEARQYDFWLGRWEGNWRQRAEGEFFHAAFSDIRPDAFRWDDHYSSDAGRSWRPGSLVEFRRVAEQGRWPAAGEPMPSFEDGGHCSDPAFAGFDFLAGGWGGEVRFEDGTTSAATLVAFRILDGCAVMSSLRYQRDGRERMLFEARSWGPASGKWFVYRLDNQPGTPHEYQVGAPEQGRLELVTTPGVRIGDPLEPFRADPAPPERPTRRTVWRALGGDRIGFELQEASEAGAGWVTRLAVSLERRW